MLKLAGAPKGIPVSVNYRPLRVHVWFSGGAPGAEVNIKRDSWECKQRAFSLTPDRQKIGRRKCSYGQQRLAVKDLVRVQTQTEIGLPGDMQHTQQRSRGEKKTVGGEAWKWQKLGNREQRVGCPSSHDIIQMALSAGPTWRGCEGPLFPPHTLLVTREEGAPLRSHTNHWAHSQMCSYKPHPARVTTDQHKSVDLTRHIYLLICI